MKNCRVCDKKFKQSPSQIKNYDYRCSACRYKTWQKNGTKLYLQRKPWWKNLHSLRKRCNDSNHDAYPYYGGRGIKAIITAEEIERLWIRDNAGNLEYPSIDRINPNGNYEYNNCRFIELSENSRRGR